MHGNEERDSYLPQNAEVEVETIYTDHLKVEPLLCLVSNPSKVLTVQI